MKKKRHILITGSHRSGTTWVGKTIARLPGLVYVHEPFNADEQERFSDPLIDHKVKTWFLHASGFAEEESLRRAIEQRFRRVTSPWLSAQDVCADRGWMSPSTPLRFAKYVLLRTAQPHRVLMKDPLAILSAPWLYQHFDMTIVCMIRNPLAFAGSLKKWNWTFDFEHFSRQEQLMKGRLSRFSDEILDFVAHPRDIVDQASLLWNCFHHVISQYQAEYPDWCYVRYEDIALNPQEGFSELIDNLNLDLTPEVVEMIDQMTSGDGSVEVDGPGFQKRNSSASLETWRKRLTSEEIERIVASTADYSSLFYHWDGERFI